MEGVKAQPAFTRPDAKKEGWNKVSSGASSTSRSGASMPKEPRIIVGDREQIFHLLAEAAEIEHTLMCSYLYAAFSLKRGEDNGLSPDEAVTVERWRDTIMGVAIEEMGHLVLVANLCVAVGARPHFDRPNFPIPPGYFPSGVVLRLTPFNQETLEHFIFIERPQGVERQDGDRFDQESDYERGEAAIGVMPNLQDYETVGHLYEALRSNLAAFAKREGQDALFIGGSEGQLGADMLDLEGIALITDLTSACEAIDQIIAQGEGSIADREDSHYHRFTLIQEEFDELRGLNPGLEPAWPAASSPVFRRPAEPEEKVFVDDPPAAAVLDLANGIYGLLLRLLVQAYGRRGPSGEEEQRHLIGIAIGLMHALAATATTLVSMPASKAHPGVNAGMSFTMLRGVEPFPPGPAESKLIEERLQELHAAAQQLVKRGWLPSKIARTLETAKASGTSASPNA